MLSTETQNNRHERRAAAAADRRQERIKLGWRLNEWCRAVGCGRSYGYILLNEQRIESVKLGRARIITTHPSDFLSSLRGEDESE
jgi:hypothetical protein